MRLFKVKYFYLLTFFIITSCQTDEKQDLIDKQMMVQILIDMHLAEESIENLKYGNDTLEALFHKKRLRFWINIILQRNYIGRVTLTTFLNLKN